MTLLESAIVLAWIAIALLSMGFAAIIRQIVVLTRMTGIQDNSRKGVGRNPVIGLRLPQDSAIEPWIAASDTHKVLLAVYVSPSCPSCDSYLRTCQAEDYLSSSGQPVIVISTGTCRIGSATWPSNWFCISNSPAEHDRIGAVALPYFAIIRYDRLIEDAGLVPSPNGLASKLSNNRTSEG